jgi:ribose/xylose/arabinose/galactoside ABC-type transport system permease subunit
VSVPVSEPGPAPQSAPVPVMAGQTPKSGQTLGRIWKTRELSTLLLLVLEVLFFAWYLWPEGGGRHPFLNAENTLLILKYSSIYGIAAIGAAIVIISGGVDLAPGAIIALAGVAMGYCFVDAQLPLSVALAAGLGVGVVSGLVSAMLVVTVGLPPFIATLGIMGITRGLAFIVTEGRYIDVSQQLPPGWAPLGVPIDWIAPGMMVVLALVFHLIMRDFQWGRAVFAIGGRAKVHIYLISGILAAVSGVILTLSQGQAKADLATGYELDIIASAVVGGASLAGGRGSVAGAVLGTLIFGVLRNALPQIPGATFYDRLIVGLVVVSIVVMDQILVRKRA